MNQAIGDEAAIQFSKGFYTALFSNINYQDSFHMGCAAIDLQGIPEYATPKIKIRRSRYQKEEKINPVKSDKNNNINNDNQGGQNRSVSMGGSASITGGAIITGENSTANIKNQNQQVSLPAPESVNIQAEINALREIIGQLETSDRRKIENAFEDAQEELNKPQPDKDEVGKPLERALEYAKKTAGFASAIAILQPHLSKNTGYLGDNWHQLLNLVGLTT
ncbi:MAG: hypothetical protein AAFW70_03735 [Cyanobacteria bacterium J06635_10]